MKNAVVHLVYPCLTSMITIGVVILVMIGHVKANTSGFTDQI